MVYEEWRDESEEKERDGRGGEKSLRKSEEASEQGGGGRGNNSFLISFLLFQKEKYKAFVHNFFERTRVREKY